MNSKKTSICIVTSSSKKPTDVALIESAKKHFDSVFSVPISNIKLVSINNKISVKYRETDISKFDSVLFRVQKSKYFLAYLVLKNLPNNILKIQNPESFLLCMNRFLLFNELSQKGVCVPKICYIDSPQIGSDVFSDMKFPLLVRALSDKEKLMFANNPNEAKAMIDTLQSLNQPIFLEEFKEADLISVFLAGEKIIKTVKRSVERESVFSRKKFSMCAPTGKIRDIALRACKVVGTKFAKVDILDLAEPCVMDVNVCPSLSWLNDPAIYDEVFRKASKLLYVERGGPVVKFFEDILNVLSLLKKS